MSSWRSYLLSVILCALVCAVVCRVLSELKQKDLIRLISGMVLTVAILRPLSGIRLEGQLLLPEGSGADGAFYAAEGEKAAFQAQARSIQEACQTYIGNKGKELGAYLQANVILDGDLLPTAVDITAEGERSVQHTLESILSTDLGIPKERQTWNWNPESN